MAVVETERHGDFQLQTVPAFANGVQDAGNRQLEGRNGAVACGIDPGAESRRVRRVDELLPVLHRARLPIHGEYRRGSQCERQDQACRNGERNAVSHSAIILSAPSRIHRFS